MSIANVCTLRTHTKDDWQNSVYRLAAFVENCPCLDNEEGYRSATTNFYTFEKEPITEISQANDIFSSEDNSLYTSAVKSIWLFV